MAQYTIKVRGASVVIETEKDYLLEILQRDSVQVIPARITSVVADRVYTVDRIRGTASFSMRELVSIRETD